MRWKICLWPPVLFGVALEVTYPAAADFIHIRLAADTPRSSPLFDAIPLRQNTRSEYDGQVIKTADLDQVQALPLEPAVALHFVTNPEGALSSLDGLYSRASGNPEVPGWLGRMFVAGARPQQQADAGVRKLRSSPSAVVAASGSDDKAAWVRNGEVDDCIEH